MSEVETVWADFWAPIVAPDGVLNLEQVKAELHDYYTLICEVPKVYDHITGGRISKPNTLASVVIAEHDEICSTADDE